MLRTNLNEMLIFMAVVDGESFVAGGQAMGLTRSAAGKAVIRLEDSLGVRLLNRTTRSVTPTEAGRLLLARLEPAMREITDALLDLSTLQQEPAGKLRLNVPRPAARLLLAPMLARFVARYPRVQVELVTDDGMIDIVRDGFDAGIRFGEHLAADMIAVPVGAPQPFVVVASPAYVAARGVPATPRALLEHACIGRRFPSGRQYAWEFGPAGEGVSIAVDGPLVFDDDELMLRAARDGAGYAYVYEADARADIAAGRLVCVLERSLPPAPRYFLYYPGRRQMPPMLRAFVDMVRADAATPQAPA